MSNQLALAIQLNDHANLAEFCWGNNQLLQQELMNSLSGHGERMFYIWGVPGSGKSHLLQACCQALTGEQSAIYLPLRLLKSWGPAAIDGIEDQSWILLDDLDEITQDSVWEEALFHLYNRIRDENRSYLVISGRHSPAEIAINLPDLRSRLSWGLVFQLHSLNDTDKINTLILHAHKRGLALSTNVGQFLLNRSGRNMHDLLELLNRLDEASLRAQRRITIPFVKDVLGI